MLCVKSDTETSSLHELSLSINSLGKALFNYIVFPLNISMLNSYLIEETFLFVDAFGRGFNLDSEMKISFSFYNPRFICSLLRLF